MPNFRKAEPVVSAHQQVKAIVTFLRINHQGFNDADFPDGRDNDLIAGHVVGVFDDAHGKDLVERQNDAPFLKPDYWSAHATLLSIPILSARKVGMDRCGKLS